MFFNIATLGSLSLFALFAQTGDVFGENPPTNTNGFDIPGLLSSVPGIAVATFILTSLLKRMLEEVSVLKSIPIWVYACFTSLALTGIAVAMQWLTIEAESWRDVVTFLVRVATSAAVASGVHSWYKNTTVAPKNASTATHTEVLTDSTVPSYPDSGIIKLLFIALSAGMLTTGVVTMTSGCARFQSPVMFESPRAHYATIVEQEMMVIENAARFTRHLHAAGEIDDGTAMTALTHIKAAAARLNEAADECEDLTKPFHAALVKLKLDLAQRAEEHLALMLPNYENLSEMIELLDTSSIFDEGLPSEPSTYEFSTPTESSRVFALAA